jgi:hypothetical protein
MMLPLAREFAQFGIRVNTIAPGIFKTPMVAGMPEDVQESLGKQVPFPPRLGAPEEYADTVAFIYGNTMVNGETIRVDGAIRMQPKCHPDAAQVGAFLSRGRAGVVLSVMARCAALYFRRGTPPHGRERPRALRQSVPLASRSVCRPK